MPTEPTLRSNPFHTYRDPKTGRWITVFPAATATINPPVANPPQLKLRPSSWPQPQAQSKSAYL